MVCLCLDWHEEREDKGSYWLIKKVCNLCGKILDYRTENK